MTGWTTRWRPLAAGLMLLGTACQAGLPVAPERPQGPAPKASQGGERTSESSALIEILKGEATDRKKLSAAQSLGQLAAGGDRAALEGLLQALGDPEGGRTRLFAAIGLQKSGSADAVEPLIAVVRDRTVDASVRKEAILTLGGLGDGRAVEPLLQVLEDPTSPEIRFAAAVALWSFRKQVPQTPILLAILKDREQPQFQRARAMQLLGKVGDATAVEPLIELLLQEPRSPELAPENAGGLDKQIYSASMNRQRNVRAKMAAVLGFLGDGRAVAPLLRVLHGAGDDRNFVQDAQAALEQIEGRVGLAPFVEALSSPDVAVRAQAVAFLGRSRKPEAEGLLQKALADNDPAIREAAAAAIAALRTPVISPAPSEKETSHDPANNAK